MWKNLLFRWSLRRTVLTLLVPALSAIGAIELWAAYRSAVDAANSAYDRSLLGAIKAIDSNISTASGGVAVELPYTMLEFFSLTASGEVFFRVATEDGLIEVGNPEIPIPKAALKTRVPQFYDAEYYGDKVRVGAYARELDRPLSNAKKRQRIVIQVAETLNSRAAFIQQLVLQAARRDFLLLFAAGGLLAIVLNLTLRPLGRLRDEVAARSPMDVTPIDTASVPADVQPLVEAINQHMLRNQQMMEARRRFVDDASHQLRTPLATLRTQLDYALRENDPDNVKHALEALSRQVDDATYRTNQMLALARADTAELTLSKLDLCEVAQQVAREVVLPAREKKIDLEYDGPDAPVWVFGHAGLLREAALNLLHNAIRFAPEYGHVSLRLSEADGYARIAVTDNGPGIPTEQLPRMGERFFRASNTQSAGSGLGLAIARAVAERCGGTVSIGNVTSGSGCVANLALPLAA
ncbi:sensor histidine kinase [Herbaspirillum sp. ST 5-3]|uniref:sensor histidine kinase n=1 Tax=Oxalobacteraceae TaxID=75682 RepID=UPI001FFFECC0|nr:sensor histidine kinase [Herbaspirillum sp. ST 5-3]